MEELKTPLSLLNFSTIEEQSPLKFESPRYKFHQRFGEKKLETETTSDDDIITAMNFDKNGNHLAVGDRAGRIVIFKYEVQKDEMNEQTLADDQFSSFLMSLPLSQRSKYSTEKKFSSSFEYDFDLCNSFEYDYVHEFQSHQEEIDVLKSKEISPQICNIEWLSSNGNEHSLVTSNRMSIKLWKVKERTRKNSFLYDESLSYFTKLKQEFPKLHQHSINSVSISQNEDIFLSSDDLKILLWDLNKPNTPYNLVDMSPVDLDDLSEVITTCNFHPLHDYLFLFSSSEGNIRIADLRKNGVCDKHCLILKQNSNLNQDCSDYAAIIRSLSASQFMNDDTKIVSRDFLNVFIWDIRKETSPVKTIPIFQPLKSKLSYLFKNEQIFDQFNMSFHSGQKEILTGNYDESFHIIDLESQKNTKYKLLEGDEIESTQINQEEKKEDFKKWNFESRILKTKFHPAKNCLAVASQNCLFLMKK